MNRLFGIAIALLFVGGAYGQEVETQVKLGKTLNNLSAAVACAHPEAATIGAEILSKGGNAVDASIAMQWALAVVYPQAGNIGGGGFMVVRMNNGEVNTLDFRETAPAAATKNMYLDDNNNVVDGKSTDTHFAVGVPGSVRGLYESSDKYGVLNMKDLIAPAIALAENGFPITEKQASLFNQYRPEFESRGPKDSPFVKTTGQWAEGDTLVQNDLAATLQRISHNGPDEFYTGRTARLIVDEMKSGGGIISLSDLENYKVIWRKPTQSEFKNFTVYSMPPPSSGGIAIAQLLKMWENADTDNITHNSIEYIHLITEMERRVYADRSVFLGDPEFHTVPEKEMLNRDYLKTRMKDFNPKKATPSSKIKEGEIGIPAESTETTHLSVVDDEGNAVSVTTTLNGHYGSKILVEGGGFFLNNEMDDFSAKPGTPNMFGLVGGEANAIAPNKRMLSSMTPTIVEKDGELFLVAGSPGGSTIITSVFQTIMNTAVFGMDLEKAIGVPKFHSQWLPDVIMLEEGRFEPEVIEKLESMGHEITTVPSLGRVDAVLVNESKTLESCGDPRGDDTAAGY